VTPTIFGIRSNISLKLLELETSNLIHGFVWAMPSRRIDNFPESRRGLGHVTLTIFGSTVGYPSDSLAPCFHYTPCTVQTCTVYRTIIVSFSMHMHTVRNTNSWLNFRACVRSLSPCLLIYVMLILPPDAVHKAQY